MKTLTIGSHVWAAPDAARQLRLRKALLACGIASSLLYVIATVLGAVVWKGYSSASQTVSELIGIGAPSAPLIVPLFILYSALVYAFGWGIWISAGQKRVLRIAAILIVAKEVFGLLITLFAPIHMRGVEGTLSDTMHGILTMVGVFLCMFPAMGFGAAAFGKWFRLYSIVTMLLFVACGVLTGSYISQMAANLPTPGMGILERINIYGYMLWIVVLAIHLLRTRPSQEVPLK